MTAARVYVWYPKGDCIGHASMHLGDHRERSSTEWYVSWWPAETGTPFNAPTADPSTLAEDEDAEHEGDIAHEYFDLEDLNIGKMKAEWDAVKGNPDKYYQLVGNNCSTVVAQVLQAGGANRNLLGGGVLGALKAFSYAHNLYWTPKNVAELCEQLCNAGHGRKVQNPGCPSARDSIGAVLKGKR
jgi:hypothetical protein